jgi:hypothetical protein
MKFILLPFFTFFSFFTSANIFICRVSVTADETLMIERSVLQAMEDAMQTLINGTLWADIDVSPNELIDFNIRLRITNGTSSGQYSGTLQLQANRPVYASSYQSVILNTVEDRFNFIFSEQESLQFDRYSFSSNLTSTLAFYAYIVSGIDFDTFSPEGGSEMFKMAENIVNIAQSSENMGWKQSERGRTNRYWLSENFVNSSSASLRKAIYIYHRQGLDIMHENTKKGRQAILESLELLEQVNSNRSSEAAMAQFFYAKSRELLLIFADADAAEKAKALALLLRLDVANANRYNEILK